MKLVKTENAPDGIRIFNGILVRLEEGITIHNQSGYTVILAPNAFVGLEPETPSEPEIDNDRLIDNAGNMLEVIEKLLNVDQNDFDAVNQVEFEAEAIINEIKNA